MERSADFLKEEVRWDHLVTSDLKKIWAAELDILKVFDQICRENGLRYFADFGTLLGTIRHQGFIPWDDDIDVSMFREDYEKFKTIVKDALPEPYGFESAYDGYKLSFMSKIRNKNTTAIQDFDFPSECNQGLFIDIYPLDDAKDGGEADEILEMAKEIWKTVTNPAAIIKGIRVGLPFHTDTALLEALCEEPTMNRFYYLEQFLRKQGGKSTKINFIYDELAMENRGLDRSWYEETVWLPFEDILMPVPGNYMDVVKHRFGDYTVVIKYASAHIGTIMDAERPYTDYLQVLKERSHILF